MQSYHILLQDVLCFLLHHMCHIFLGLSNLMHHVDINFRVFFPNYTIRNLSRVWIVCAIPGNSA